MNRLPFENINRKIIIKKKAKGKIGCEPEKRPVDKLFNFGIVNIDKPAGPTSHNVAAFVKKILNVDKTGHSGTLDPSVTGCLPVALGKATKVLDALLVAGKEYVCIMHIHGDFAEEKIKSEFKKLIGKIKQVPPKKSAVKREERERNVYYIDILEIKERDVLFKIGCQAGTYIRKICHDFGQNLGCGAHMKELRRTKAGPFDETTLVSLIDLKDAYELWKEKGNENELRKCIHPFEKAAEYLPKVWVLDEAIDLIKHGRNLRSELISKFEETDDKSNVAILTLKGELIAIGKLVLNSDEILKKEKEIAVKIEKLFK